MKTITMTLDDYNEVEEPFFLTKSHVGVKVCLPGWEEGSYFVPSDSQDPNSEELVRGTGYDKYGKYETAWFNDQEWYLYLGLEAKAPEGVSLQEAIGSGKDFRPIGDEVWCYYAKMPGTVVIRHESGEINAPLNPAFINARYELKPDPKKVEVTAAQLEKAWLGWWGTGPGMEGWLPYLKRELGLEE